MVECLRRFAPDVVFVQEAPRFLRAQARLARLARESGLVVASTGHGAHGVAILTRLRLSVHGPAQLELPRTPGLHRRGIARADVSLGAKAFTAVSVHLGLDGAERRRHAALIKDTLEWVPGGVCVLGGDLNALPGSPAWRVLGEGLTDAGAEAQLPTFPAVSPKSRIDTLFVPRGWSAEVVEPRDLVDDALLVRATDHRPVIVDVVD